MSGPKIPLEPPSVTLLSSQFRPVIFAVLDKNKAASRAFYANKLILSHKSVSIAQRLAYFDAMVTPVACFASGHRKIYKQDLRKLDVKFRKLVRTIVGPVAA